MVFLKFECKKFRNLSFLPLQWEIPCSLRLMHSTVDVSENLLIVQLLQLFLTPSQHGNVLRFIVLTGGRMLRKGSHNMSDQNVTIK